MPQDQTFNLLVWEDNNTLPFPKEIVLPLGIGEYQWQTEGFPDNFVKYIIAGGKQLYSEGRIGGEIDIKKSDFTGKCRISTFIVNDGGPNNYHVSFDLLFLRGEMIESTFHHSSALDSEKYNKSKLDLKAKLDKIKKRERSFLFKFLYRPYRFVIRWSALLVIFLLRVATLILSFIEDVLRKIVGFITPF